jgi:hypothetical protein
MEKTKIKNLENYQNIKGIAHLCFIKKKDIEKNKLNNYIQGHIIDFKTKKSYGIMGIESIKQQKTCCFDSEDPSIYFNLKIVDFYNNYEFYQEVEKKGGDFARIFSSKIIFTPEILKIDNEAKLYIQKYFPKLLNFEFEDIFINIGEILIENIQFKSPLSKK